MNRMLMLLLGAVLLFVGQSAQAVSRTYYQYFNTLTILTQPLVTTNVLCPALADTVMLSPGVSLLADAKDATCVPSVSRDVKWSTASQMSLYYNGAGYAAPMNVTGTSVGVRARGIVAGSILTARLFYTTTAGAQVYFTGTPGTVAVTTARADYTIGLAGLSASNVPAGAKLGVEFSWTNATGMRLSFNQSANNDKLIVDETPGGPGVPTVVTNAATALTAAGATLNGLVSSNGADTAVSFEYGLTTAYGVTVVAAENPLAASAANSPVTSVLSGLTCGALYHFRAVGTNSYGTTYGGDRTFTTSACVTPTFVFTNSPCVANIAFGALGQTCTQMPWTPRVAGQTSANVYITAVNTSGVPTPLNMFANRTRSMQFGLSCHNPAADAGKQAAFAGVSLPLCQPNGGDPANWSTAVTVTFNAGNPSSSVPYTFNYADVGMVDLWMRNRTSPAQVGFSGPFVVKPGGFVLSAIKRTSDGFANPGAANANGAKFVKAGEAFSVTVTATTCAPASATCTVVGAATPNYGQEAAPKSVRFVDVSLPSTDANYANHATLVGGLGLTSNPAMAGAFGTFASGVATGTAFSWEEVGIITLTPSVSDGDYLGVGDVIGTTTGNVGRFYPDHFDTVVKYQPATRVFMPCPTGLVCPNSGDSSLSWTYADASARTSATGFVVADIGKIAQQASDNTYWKLIATTPVWEAFSWAGFVYSGQPFSVRVTARSLGGNKTGNYASTFAKAVTLAAWDALGSTATKNPGLGALANNAIVATDFTAGEAMVAAPTYTFTAIKTAPTDIFMRADESSGTDGVTSLRAIPVTSVEGGVKVASGRIKLSNPYGSELLALPLTATVQYWNGTNWVTSATDNETGLTLAATYNVLNKSGATTGTTAPAPTGAATVVNGILNISLSKPTGGAGSATVNPTVPGYLPLTGGVATFGVYRGNREFIYLRENY